MLTGQAKKDYQRAYMKDYMRNRRKSVKTSVKTQDNVKTQPVLLRPEPLPVVKTQKIRRPDRPAGCSENQYNYICYKAGYI